MANETDHRNVATQKNNSKRQGSLFPKGKLCLMMACCFLKKRQTPPSNRIPVKNNSSKQAWNKAHRTLTSV